MRHYRVALQDTTTGETRWYDDPTGYLGDEREFHWCWDEGHFACDCNRGRFFARAGGEADPDIPCGEGRYYLVDAVFEETPLDAPDTFS